MKFNKEEIDALGIELRECLKKFGEQHGIELTFKSIIYDDEEFTCKVIGRQPNIDFDLKNWCEYCWREGFEPKDYGKLFQIKGETYKIVGISQRKRKAPIVLEKISDHEEYMAGTMFVKRALAKSKR